MDKKLNKLILNNYGTTYKIGIGYLPITIDKVIDIEKLSIKILEPINDEKLNIEINFDKFPNLKKITIKTYDNLNNIYDNIRLYGDRDLSNVKLHIDGNIKYDLILPYLKKLNNYNNLNYIILTTNDYGDINMQIYDDLSLKKFICICCYCNQNDMIKKLKTQNLNNIIKFELYFEICHECQIGNIDIIKYIDNNLVKLKSLKIRINEHLRKFIVLPKKIKLDKFYIDNYYHATDDRQILNFSHNQQQLKKIKINSFMYLQCFQFKDFINLTHLELYFNRDSIPIYFHYVCNLTNLKKLVLVGKKHPNRHNYFDISKSINNLKKLEYLHINYGEKLKIKFKNLIILKLYNIRKLEVSFKNMKKLKQLNISHFTNNIKLNDLSLCKSLESLKLKNINIGDLKLENLTNLLYLSLTRSNCVSDDFYNNKINNLINLKHLQSIFENNNNIKLNLFNMKNLKKIISTLDMLKLYPENLCQLEVMFINKFSNENDILKIKYLNNLNHLCCISEFNKIRYLKIMKDIKSLKTFQYRGKFPVEFIKYGNIDADLSYNKKRKLGILYKIKYKNIYNHIF